MLQSVTSILLLCIRWCRLVWIPSSEQSLLIFHCCVRHPHFKGHRFCDNTWRGGLAILPRHQLNAFIRIQYWVRGPAGDKDMLWMRLQTICLVLINISRDWETVMFMIEVSQMLTIFVVVESLQCRGEISLHHAGFYSWALLVKRTFLLPVFEWGCHAYSVSRQSVRKQFTVHEWYARFIVPFTLLIHNSGTVSTSEHTPTDPLPLPHPRITHRS